MKAFIFLESNNLLPICKVQKGCRRMSYGYKDQLIINKAFLEEVSFATRRPLSVLINTFTLLHFVKDPHDRKSLYSISRQSMKFNRELGVPAIPPAEDEANTTHALRTKAEAKHQGRQLLRLKLESKSLHGKYPQRMKQAGTRQDPQMAKSSWPQGRNRGLYHRSPRSKPPNTLVTAQHTQEA